MKAIVYTLLTASSGAQRVDFSQFTQGFLPKQLLGQKCDSQLPYLGCNQFAVKPEGAPLFKNEASKLEIARASGKSEFKPGTDKKLDNKSPEQNSHTITENGTTSTRPAKEGDSSFDPCLEANASEGLSCLQPLPLRCQAPEEVTGITSGAHTCILASDCGYDWIVDDKKEFVGDKPIPDICPRRNSQEVQDYTKRYFNTKTAPLSLSQGSTVLSLKQKRLRTTDFEAQCAAETTRIAALAGPPPAPDCDPQSDLATAFEPIYTDADFTYNEVTEQWDLTTVANFNLDELEYKEYCQSVVTPTPNPPSTAFINALAADHERKTRHCDAKIQTLAGTVLAAIAISLSQ